jgi:hypothetical protein
MPHRSALLSHKPHSLGFQSRFLNSWHGRKRHFNFNSHIGVVDNLYKRTSSEGHVEYTNKSRSNDQASLCNKREL